MITQYFVQHWVDDKGNPAGGISNGPGFTISWQNGPTKEHGDQVEINGAFVETILDAVYNRLWFYQQGKFKCQENKRAMKFIMRAIDALQERTRSREEQGVEGTHELHKSNSECVHYWNTERPDYDQRDKKRCLKCGEVDDG